VVGGAINDLRDLRLVTPTPFTHFPRRIHLTKCINVQLHSGREAARRFRSDVVLKAVETEVSTASTSHKLLIAANRRKDEFVAMLGHELRGPLASINNALRILGDPTGTDPMRQRAQGMLQRQVRRMTRLVDDILDVSRVTSGRLRVQLERADLRVIVAQAIETVEADVGLAGRQLSIEMPDTPVWLQADPARLEQVIVNLLSNAAKYTDLGGEISIWMHMRAGEAIIRVRDSGVGIAPDALPRIFDLFEQADEADPRSRSGLGVGLAVVRTLLELHGGSVVAASAGTGRGSEFTVRLPRHD
jgi:signal transduction histidine kinase